MTVKEKIEQLRLQLHQHNYNYYVLNAPEISDKEFDDLMRELQDLEQEHPEYKDENSPTMRVGSDIRNREPASDFRNKTFSFKLSRTRERRQLLISEHGFNNSFQKDKITVFSPASTHNLLN